MVKEIYTIYNDDTNNRVAEIYYDIASGVYTSELFIADEAPFVFSNFSETAEGGIDVGGCPHPDSDVLEFWLKDRVIPENRDLIKETLRKVGIHEYNWREMIKLNLGKSVSDMFSVEVSYE